VARTVVEIDLSGPGIRTEECPEDLRLLGGRGLTSTLIQRETDPLCHPLAPENLLVIAPGLLAGTGLSSANRLSAGAKSPLTGGIKEANSGGTAAFKLARLGIAALKFRGSAPRGRCLGLHVSREGCRLEDLGFLAGNGIYPTAEALRERFGARVGLIIAGPAGEMRMSTACLSVTDPEGEPCRNLGRGGLGAVAGAKGLKAVIIDDEGAEFRPHDPEATKALIRDFAARLKAHPVTGEKFPKYGTAMTLMNVNKLGGLPTRNFSAGSFEGPKA
jgi:aldehyde:ferredoxin oxidoreductase